MKIIIHYNLSKGASNEEMVSQDHHLHLCDTDTENTSLLVNNSNISLLFPPNTFMVITRGALMHRLQGAEAQGPTLERGPTGCREIIFL